MVHHTDRCPLQRHDQSDIMLHRSSPSLRGPHEDGLIRCWRADSLCLRLARSRNYPMLQKSPLRSCRIKIRNNRIGANGFLNQRCALTPDLESILRTQTGKARSRTGEKQMPKQKPAAPKDLVDDLYIPFARPLGNLAILFAQAEARWLELVVELTGCTHKEAQRLLTISAADAKREVIPFAQARGIEGPEHDELSV